MSGPAPRVQESVLGQKIEWLLHFTEHKCFMLQQFDIWLPPRNYLFDILSVIRGASMVLSNLEVENLAWI